METETNSDRKKDILKAISACEWLETFRRDGQWSRYRDEEKALVALLDRRGIVPVRRADGEIDGYLTLDNLGSLI
jgi:hypothetical protein